MIDEFLRERNVFAPPPFKNAKHDGPAISESELRRAVSDDQLFLMYQPVIACPRRKLKGFEALIRWQHPQHGLVMPDSFIGIAESTGLIHDITSIVADLSLKWISGSTALNDMTLSINVSAKSLDDKQFPDRLGAAALKAGVSPTKIILEVTETAAASDELLALDLFTRLRVKGFKVSIDDFGIGSSSLALLARLPCSELKVDPSFAMAATESEEARAIIRSTMDLSRNLNLDVVTEGIENQETLDYIEAVGCDFAQGYYIARPMLGEQALDWAISSPYAN
jgi:EAL domain-containing protein (putative c-di-GMP-specific phosphodiesterase class I)